MVRTRGGWSEANGFKYVDSSVQHWCLVLLRLSHRPIEDSFSFSGGLHFRGMFVYVRSRTLLC
jgi:hypothetical protein